MWRREHKEALQVLADVFLDQRQIHKAVILLEALDLLDPHDIEIMKALSYAYLLAGRHEDVLNTVDAFLSLDDTLQDNAPILLIRAKAAEALGRSAEARDNLNQYMELIGRE